MKTEEQLSREEYQRKADQAAINIKYAVNKKLAIQQFLYYLYRSI